jgi:hypothetical protein
VNQWIFSGFVLTLTVPRELEYVSPTMDASER